MSKGRRGKKVALKKEELLCVLFLSCVVEVLFSVFFVLVVREKEYLPRQREVILTKKVLKTKRLT